MSGPRRWTTPVEIVTAVRRRWTDGSLLRALAAGESFPVLRVPLRGPSATDLGDDLDAARSWVGSIQRAGRDGAAYQVETATVGGRFGGRTALPVRAVVSRFDQAWLLLGAEGEVDAFTAVLRASEGVESAERWVLAHPVQAAAAAGDWSRVLAAHRWLDAHRGSGLHLRQISAPGVDTKFVERHRGVLAPLLGVPASAAGFAAALGLAAKPATVRLRFDPALLGMPAGITEGTLRAEELEALDVAPRSVLIVENEVTYLSVPVPAGGVVLWGRGFDVDAPASLGWLADAAVRYWGDLDTHGFAILDRVRAHLPDAVAVLMDRATLMAHEEFWGREDRPTSAALSRLDAEEHALYEDLVADRLGSSVRLEQERIEWRWAMERLAL